MSQLQELNIPFMNTTLIAYLQKTNQARKGIIVYFGGFPGGPANPKTQIEYLQLSSKMESRPSSSLGRELFLDNGFDFVTFDYPGFWKTAGTFTISNSIKAGEAVLNFIINIFPNISLFIFAQSFGTGISINSITTTIVKKLVLIAPMPHVSNTMFASETIRNGYIQTSKSMVNNGVINTQIQFWEEQKLESFFSELAIANNITKIIGLGIPTKAIIGINDGIFSVPAVKQLYSRNIDLEIWDDLPHIILSESIRNKLKNYIIHFFLA